jgi:hypothetical protein
MAKAWTRVREFLATKKAFEWIDAAIDYVGYPKVAVVAITAVTSAWSWLAVELPVWAIFLGAVFIAACVLWGIRQIVVARTVMAFDTKAYRALGAELSKLGREIADFVAEQEREQEIERLRSAPIPDSDPRVLWLNDIRMSKEIASQFTRRFAGKVHASFVILKKIGVTVPWRMISASGSEIGTLSVYLSTIGELLERGAIEEAKNLDEHHVFWMRG